jgi:hypothetical protein
VGFAATEQVRVPSLVEEHGDIGGSDARQVKALQEHWLRSFDDARDKTKGILLLLCRLMISYSPALKRSRGLYFGTTELLRACTMEAVGSGMMLPHDLIWIKIYGAATECYNHPTVAAFFGTHYFSFFFLSWLSIYPLNLACIGLVKFLE